MRSILVLITFFHSLLAFNYDLKPVKVDATTYCFFGLPQGIDEHNNGNMVNSCFVDVGDSYLVVDSGPTYQYAQQSYTQMKKIKNLPVSHVINTHIHDDHWLGNGYYQEIGAKIIGSSQFKHESILETTRMQQRVSKEAYAKTTSVFPSILIDKDTVLTIAKQEIQIIHVNKKAHSSGDLLVYIPSSKLLFAGDLVFNDRLPSLRDGDANFWIKEIDYIRSLNPAHIIGGHGEIVNSSAADFTYGYLVALKQEVKKAIDNGVTIEDAVQTITLPQYENANMYNTMHKQNVESTYRTMEWSNE